MKLERLLVALTIVNLALLAFLLTRVTAERDDQNVLRGERLELVDANGTVRASFRTEPGGAGVFRLMDDQGTIRVKLGAGRDGSGLVLENDATEPGVQMLAKDDGTSVKLRNKDGSERVIRP